MMVCAEAVCVHSRHAEGDDVYDGVCRSSMCSFTTR